MSSNATITVTHCSGPVQPLGIFITFKHGVTVSAHRCSGLLYHRVKIQFTGRNVYTFLNFQAFMKAECEGRSISVQQSTILHPRARLGFFAWKTFLKGLFLITDLVLWYSMTSVVARNSLFHTRRVLWGQS